MANRILWPIHASEQLQGVAAQSLGVLPGAREGGPDSGRDLTWRVRSTAVGGPGRVEITVSSEKAGTLRHIVELSATHRRSP